MHIYYRLSDGSYQKPKLPSCTKAFCLRNFVEEVCQPDDRLHVILDNCKPETIRWVNEQYGGRPNVSLTESYQGNAGSFRLALTMATSTDTLLDDDIVYMVEDDYIHHTTAAAMLREAPADYWTVYDHPGKYGPMYDYGESSKVFKTRATHWRYTVSTTMTFAARAAVLRADYHDWLKYTANSHPHDHQAFQALGQKGRQIAVAIPGAAWHTDLTESLREERILIDDMCFYIVIETLAGRNELDVGVAHEIKRRVTEADCGPLSKAKALATLDMMCRDKKTHPAATG